MRLLINIRGCNGSGKSTPLLQMKEADPNMYEVSVNSDGRNPKLTVFPKFKVVALGHYHAKCGGMDTLKNNEETRQALFRALDDPFFQEYDIIAEGVISSTVYSTYTELFQELEQRYEGLNVLIINISTPLDICLKRIQSRNGGKPIKEEQVYAKRNGVLRNHNKFKEDGLYSVRYDNTLVLEREALDKLVAFIDKHRVKIAQKRGI